MSDYKSVSQVVREILRRSEFAESAPKLPKAGAGEEGTPEATAQFKKDTPGQEPEIVEPLEEKKDMPVAPPRDDERCEPDRVVDDAKKNNWRRQVRLKVVDESARSARRREQLEAVFMEWLKNSSPVAYKKISEEKQS
jgi:hypothetical protein